MPDFPIFSCTLKGVSNGIEFACGGGSGEASFIGTPLHLFYNTVWTILNNLTLLGQLQ